MEGNKNSRSISESKSANLFAAKFLRECPPWDAPAGAYDPESQLYIKTDDGMPAFTRDGLYATQGGNEITTHPSTTVSGVTFTDTDNG